MPEKTTQAHLRVRLPAADKSFLCELSSKNGVKPNISRAVKLLIEKERKTCTVIEVLPSTRKKIQRLSDLLMRSNAQVVDESIDTIIGLINNDKLPLLVMELRLVKKYFTGRGKKVKAR